jgi:hypothetical protein
VELLAQAVGQLITFALQVLVYARKFSQLDDTRIVQAHAAKAGLISAQRVSQHERVPPVVLGSAYAVAVAKTIELLGVDRIDG